MLKRILYIGGFELPDKNAAAHRVLSIAKAWRDNGVEVIFIGISKETSEYDILKTRTKCEGFTTFSIPYPKKKLEWVKYLISIKYIKEIIENLDGVDGIICYNYQTLAFERLRRFCGKKRIKIYADCTEWYNTDGQNILFKLIKGLDVWYRMNVIHKKLDGMIVISSYLKDYYRKYSNIICIPPLVDKFENKWNIKAKILSNSINFVYTGQPGNKDKIDRIVNSFIDISEKYDSELWIIGITESDFKNNYPGFSKLMIPSNIHFLGRIPHEESLAYSKGADCSLIIRDSTRTNNAGFPTKFVESVTLGTDVIATDISDLKKYISILDNSYIVETTLERTMEEFIKKGKINKHIMNDMFDYRRWEKAIIELIEGDEKNEVK